MKKGNTMKRFLPFLMLILAVLCLGTSGCSTTYPMKVAMCRAATDITVNGLIDNKVLSSQDELLVVEQLRAVLDDIENVPQYTEQVYAVTAP